MTERGSNGDLLKTDKVSESKESTRPLVLPGKSLGRASGTSFFVLLCKMAGGQVRIL